ncbi:MAG: DsbA oxidoreductase [uncultured bacterium]|nr:MAG: DsbA oxidoreductase [uncultured bacterium]
MIRSRHILLGIIPALLIVIAIFSFRILQYNALFSTPDTSKTTSLDLIPILPDDPILGAPNAPYTVVVFSDLACTGCRAQDMILKDVQKKHPGKLKIIWKGLPVVPFPYTSGPAHEYAFCANKQEKFESFKDFAYANFDNLSRATIGTIVEEIDLDETKLNACLDSGEATTYIDTVRTLAELLHVQSVPTIFFENEQIITPTSVDEWEVVLGL